MSNINLVARGRIPSVHFITTALVFHLSYIDLYVHGDVFRGDGSSFLIALLTLLSCSQGVNRQWQRDV